MMFGFVCLALAPVLFVEGSNSQALALAPSYNEQLIHQINAARQMAVNKLAASLGTGTGTAHFDGVPGTRFARPRKGPKKDPHNAPAPHPPPHYQLTPTVPNRYIHAAHVLPTPVYPTPAVYTTHPHAGYAFPANHYPAPHVQNPYQTVFANIRAPQGQIYPSGAAYTGDSHGQGYSNSNAFLRAYNKGQNASPRPHAKSASSVLGMFGFDSEPFFFNEQARMFGYDNSVQEHYIKVMSNHKNKQEPLFGAKETHFNILKGRSESSKPPAKNPFEEPKYEEPKYEEPKYEEPKYEEPKYEEPKYEPPKYEPPKYEPPKYEPPKYEPPKYEPPKYEEPIHSYAPPQKSLTPPKKSYQVPPKTFQTYKHIHGSGRRGSVFHMHAFVPVAIHGYGRY